MSGNASRKYKQYKLMQERRKLFGDVTAKDECDALDLVAFGAALGRIITSSTRYDAGKVNVKTKRRKTKALV